jgi:hypothetical protein
MTAEEITAKLGVTEAELGGYDSRRQILAVEAESSYRYPV